MALDRDELAARCLVAILTPVVGDMPAHEWEMGKMAGAAVDAADALLAALVPVAPASGAPAPLPGAPLAALAPAAWVPSVGDVVAPNGEWAKRGGCDEAVVRYVREGDIDKDRCGVGIYILKGSHRCQTPEVSHDLTYLRRATSAERAAAGLPVDEESLRSGDDRPASGQSATKPVDRVALAKAIRDGWIGTTRGISPWNDANPSAYGDWLNAADAAIAFMAKGGVA